MEGSEPLRHQHNTLLITNGVEPAENLSRRRTTSDELDFLSWFSAAINFISFHYNTRNSTSDV